MQVISFETHRETHTDYLVSAGVLSSGEMLGRLEDNPVFLVADSTVARLHASAIDLLRQNTRCLSVMTIDGGEKAKSLTQVDRIIDMCEKKHLPKHGIILAVGGGTVCDVVAVAAMLFRRGVALMLIPTTLLSQVDAAVGGKNGVNHGRSKNLVGNFYHPDVVCCDQDFLLTLGENEIICGIAEIIKVLAVSDADSFRRHFPAGGATTDARKNQDWSALVRDALSLKLDLLAEDPFERSSKRLLNYGHAFAHFFEENSNYDLAHGEAVLLGMLIENEISREMGIGDEVAIEDLQQLIERYLTEKCRFHWMRYSDIRSHIARLREARRGCMNIVCIKEAGSACILDNVDDRTLEHAWGRAEVFIARTQGFRRNRRDLRGRRTSKDSGTKPSRRSPARELAPD